MNILPSVRETVRLAARCLTILLCVGFETVQAYDLLDTENTPVALFINAYPVLSRTESSSNLKYYVSETCGSTKSGDCEMFEFSCRADTNDRYDLLYWGLSLAHANFSGSITSGYELPHVIYFDRLVERHRSDLLDPPAIDLEKSARIVRFYFKRAEKLKDKGEHSYLLTWDTQSSADAETLSEMLSSGETIFVPYPVRLRQLLYNKLHPMDETDESDIATGFVAACNDLWGKQE
jgi:hypothetical protein